MLNWAKNAVGITDANHGPGAIQSVAEQTTEKRYTELTKDDLRWECMHGTNVETKTFYMTSDEGKIGLAQIIYSDVMGVRTTAQFSSKIFASKEDLEAGKVHQWASDNLQDFQFSQDRQNFDAKACSMHLSEDGKAYTIKSTVNRTQQVHLTFTQTAPGFKAGHNGTTTFGTDPMQPWGRMKHFFWPRCKVEGHIITPSGPVDFKGRGIFIHALQGMKPHFAAAKWNFCNFQSPTYSAVLMEFTTPGSYGGTVVAVGGIAKEGEIVVAGASPAVKVEHTQVKGDPENDWPEPAAVRFSWPGPSGKEDGAVLEGSILPRVDRVDIMGELPKFVKQIVAGAAGTKPYIYQYTPKLKIKVGDHEEEGQLFMEATFIS